MSKRKSPEDDDGMCESPQQTYRKARQTSPGRMSEEYPQQEVVGVPYADMPHGSSVRFDMSPTAYRWRRPRVPAHDMRDPRRRLGGGPCWSRELHRPSTWPPEEVKAALHKRAFMKMSIIDLTNKIRSMEKDSCKTPQHASCLRSYKECLNKLLEKYRTAFPELELEQFPQW